MDNKQLEKLEKKMLEHPELRDFVLREQEIRKATIEKKADREYYESIFGIMRDSLEKISGVADSAEFMLKNVGVIASIADTLQSVIKEVSHENEKEMIDTLKGVQTTLLEIEKKVATPPVVNIAPAKAPIIEVKAPEVPAPVVIDKTTVIQETKHIEKAVETLKDIAKKLSSDRVYIKNAEPNDAISVRFVDKNGKTFTDFAEAISRIQIPVGGGGSKIAHTASQDDPLHVSISSALIIDDSTPIEVNISSPIYVDSTIPVSVTVSSPIEINDSTPIQVAETGTPTVNQGTPAAVSNSWPVYGGVKSEVTGSGSGVGQFPVTAIDVSDYQEIELQFYGTFSATTALEGSNDGIGWVQVVGLDVASNTGGLARLTTAPTIYIIPVHFKYFRARISAYTSGTVSAIAELKNFSSHSLSGAVSISGGPISLSNSNQKTSFSGTGVGTALQFSQNPLSKFGLSVARKGGTATSWTVNLQISLDNTIWTTILTHTLATTGDGQIITTLNNFYPAQYARAQCTAVVLGTATSIEASIVGML